MAKIYDVAGEPTSSLRKRKAALLEKLSVPRDALRASCVRQFVTCGKPNCRCRSGAKHGPFHYLVQCVRSGKTRKFLLKSSDQRQHARTSIAAYAAFQERFEELSQINTELLRRGEMVE